MAEAPKGAEWAQAPRVIERLIYRADGAGFLDPLGRLEHLPAGGADVLDHHDRGACILRHVH